MKLDNFENSINPVILQRGKNYTAFVEDLEETEPEFWQAYVEGTETYDVEIQLDGDAVSAWFCTCPYDQGPICKHVVATLLNIRQQQGSSPKAGKSQKPTKREQLEQVFKNLKREELEDYLRQLLHGDRKRLDKFLLRFQPLPADTESIARHYRQQFEHIVQQYSYHGFIEYQDSDPFAAEIQELLNTLPANQLAPAARIAACFAVAQGIAGVANNIDDSSGELGSLMYSIKDELAAAYPELPGPEQAQLFQRTLATQFDDRYTEFGLEDAFADLLEEWGQASREYQDTYLQAISNRLRSHPHD